MNRAGTWAGVPWSIHCWSLSSWDPFQGPSEGIFPAAQGADDGVGVLDDVLVIEQIKRRSIESRSFVRNKGLMSRLEGELVAFSR